MYSDAAPQDCGCCLVSDSSLEIVAMNNVLQPPTTNLYVKKYYEARNAFGIRRQVGQRRQVILVRKEGATRQQLEMIANRAINRLLAGGSEDDVKAWVVRMLDRF